MFALSNRGQYLTRGPRSQGVVRRSSDVHAMGPAHRAYFNGEVLWTYFTTPFFAMQGVRVEETEALSLATPRGRIPDTGY